MSTTNKPTPERKAALSNICDAENYLPIVSECLSEDQKRILRPHHMSNVMALTAELFLGNYDGIAAAFERNASLEISLKVKLASEKDGVELSYKPVEVFKDFASANLPDENQATFDFKKGANAPESQGEIVEAEVIPALPAPLKLLPAPAEEEQTPSEKEAFRLGIEKFKRDTADWQECPYELESAEEAAFLEGWRLADAATVILDGRAAIRAFESAEEGVSEGYYLQILILALQMEEGGRARRTVISRIKREIETRPTQPTSDADTDAVI